MIVEVAIFVILKKVKGINLSTPFLYLKDKPKQ